MHKQNFILVCQSCGALIATTQTDCPECGAGSDFLKLYHITHDYQVGEEVSEF